MARKRPPRLGINAEELVAEVSYCGQHLHDLAAIDLTGIANLAVVEKLAEGNPKMFARGIIVRDLFKNCAQVVLDRLPAGDRRSEMVAATIDAWLSGQTIASVARAFNRTRSYWSRTYRRYAAELIAVELMRELEALRLQQSQISDTAKVAQIPAYKNQIVM